MKFTKMHGCGNDYVYVNCLEEKINNPNKVAKFISDRHFGIGSDGMICICPSDKADFRMAMYNSDGSEGAMCGNGVRCIAKYVYDYGLTDKTTITIETKGGIKELDLTVEDGKVTWVKVDMEAPITKASQIPAIYDDLDEVIDQPVIVDGKEYNITCISMGNPHGVVFVDSVADIDIEKIGPKFENHPMFPDRVNTQALLAEKVCETIGMDKIFYQNSGTEANEAMIKMARKYGIEKYGPNHYHIVTAKMGFHGRTFGAMSATGQPGNGCQVGFGPMTYGFSYAPYNNLQAFKDACTENTIAIMIEPVQGEGGVHPATQEFMKGLREFCDENDMLLLIDEVQTGWCRTGAVMSYMNYGIKPDIVSMAKGLGGGMPIGAICATAEVAKAFTPGSHGTTFGGHPVSCAAALAEVNELIDRDLAGNAKKVGDYFAEKLKGLPHVKEVRHQGLLTGIEFDDTLNAVDIKHACFDRKLLVTAIGSSVIRTIPPLIVTEEECDKAFAIMKEAVESLA